MKEILEKNKICYIGLGMIFYFLIIYVIDIHIKINISNTIGSVAILIIVLITNYLIVKECKNTQKINYKKIITAIMIVGFVLRTVYILYTPITERQHDMEEDVGHLAYIRTIYETGKLPKSNKWQFYQQPLHHIIAAGWLKVNEFFNVDTETAEEGIQILTAIYSSMIILITYSILKEINIKDVYKIFVMLIIAVHPTFIILSGSINNDILVTMLTFLDFLYIIKWDKNPSFKNTIILAIFTALTALTKISGTIIAVPIIYIFLNKFIEEIVKGKNKQNIKNYIIKFAIFGIISIRNRFII